MRARVQRMFENLREPDRVDCIALLMGVDPHLDMSFFYATDLTGGGLFERSVALLWPDGRLEMLTSPLEEASARKAAEVELSVWKGGSDEKKAWVAERLKGVERVGVNAPELTFDDYRFLRDALPDSVDVVDVQRAVAHARLVKDAREIERMQNAADIASEVADAIPDVLADGLREFELAAEIAYRMQRKGASGTSFDSIVSFGETSAEPHYSPGEVALEKGQFVLCDFGAYWQRYASDITRSWVYGKASADQRDIYTTVLRAQEAAIDAVKPGAKGGAVHEAAAAVIDASQWKGRFIHSIGHSLGLSVHDGGSLNPRVDLTLEPGMVVTIEPGIYVPGLGGVRIEDDVVVTEDGCRLLTSAKKEFVEV